MGSFALTIQMGSFALTIQPGQRWMAVVLGLPQAVRVIEPSYVSPHQWMCLLETNGELVAINEEALEEFLPEAPSDAPEHVDVPPVGL
jgi:hypothetical protein